MQKIVLLTIMLFLFVFFLSDSQSLNNFYAKNYFETLLGSNNHPENNRYNIIDLSIGEAVKSDYAEKNIDGYDLMLLPINLNLFTFINSSLREYFDFNRKQPVFLPSIITLEFYNLLSDSAKLIYTTINVNDEKIKNLFKEFESATIVLDENIIKIMNKDNLIIENPRYVNILSRLVLFEAKQGLFLFSEYSDLSIYLLQFNRRNLRSYTVNNNIFDDKSYYDLCLEIDEINNPFFYKTLLKVTLNGFKENTLLGLSQVERQLLFDVYGISMAEYYKSMNLKNFKGSFDENISGSNIIINVLLSMHFNNGGKILNKDSEGYKILDASCITFEEKFSQRRSLRLLQESLITSYIKDNHQNFFNKLNDQIIGEGQNLFEEIFQDIETNSARIYSDELIEEFIEIVYYNTDEINAYMRLIIENLNSEENVKLSENFNQVRWL